MIILNMPSSYTCPASLNAHINPLDPHPRVWYTRAMSAVTSTKSKSSKPPKREAISKTHKPSMKAVGRDPATGKVIPHVRDERLAKRVAFHVAAGISSNDIAEMLNIRPGLLKECYAKELKHGLNQMVVEVAGAMKNAALAGDTTAGKFLLKARAGWKDGESAQQSASPLQIHIHE